MDLRGGSEQPALDSGGAIGEFPKSFFKPTDHAESGQGICTDKIDAELVKSPPDKRLPDSFLNNCSGCHGTAGEGHADFPSIKKASKERLQSIVRGGSARMPAFASDLLSDEEIDKIFNKLTENLDPFDTQVNLNLPTSEISDDDYVKAMKVGLLAWRTPGDRGACVSCHGPDGIDLARINYPNSAIFRRALGQGLPGDRATSIVRMIAAQRNRYFIKTPCKASSFIPLQPGDQIINGNDTEEKDRKLVDALKKSDVDLSQAVSSDIIAKSLISKIAALDIGTIPIAVKLNHWTEDSFHGDSHKSTAEWLPEIPLEAKSDDEQKKWIALQNNYLQDPKDENFWALLDGVDSLDGHRFTTGGVSERIAREKYRSVLLLQHMMRFNSRKMPDLTKTKNVDRFSIWETAQVSNVMARGCADAGSDSEPYPCWKYPQSFYKKMGTDRARLLNDVLKIDFPWLVAGWMLDPALQLTESGDAQIAHLHAAAEKHLSTFDVPSGKFAQLPIHNIYISFARLVKSIESLNDKLPSGSQHHETAINGCWANIGSGINQWVESTLPVIENEISDSATPAISSTHKQLVSSLVAAANRSILFMLQSSVSKPNPACSALKARSGVLGLKDVATKIKAWHDKNKMPDDLIDKLTANLSK